MLPYERANEDLQYGTGFAYNASGQWAAESGIGMLKAGKKTDPRLPRMSHVSPTITPPAHRLTTGPSPKIGGMVAKVDQGG